MGIVIRRADLGDLPELMVQLKKFSDFYNSKYPLFGDDSAYNVAILSTLITNQLFLVAEQDTKVLGFIAGLISPHMFNPSITTLTEIFWWVNEESRQSRAGAMLLKEFTDYGKKNCQWIIMTLEHNSPIKPESILNRGFRHKETAFVMEI